MKKILYVAFTTLATLTSCGAAADCKNHFILEDPCVEREWVSAGTMNVARSQHTSTLLPDGRVLVAGGRGNAGQAMDNAELYDPATGAWALSGKLHLPRIGHQAVLLPDGRVLVVGGDAPQDHWSWKAANGPAELYDPHTQTWRLTGKLNSGRDSFSMTLLQTGEVMVAGGLGDWGEPLRSVELYDPALGAWRFTGELATARYDHTATLLHDGKVLVVAGSRESMSESPLGDAELYEPHGGRWTVAGRIGRARLYHSASLLESGEILIAGGLATLWGYPLAQGGYGAVPAAYSTVDVFAPKSGWSAGTGLNTPRAGHVSTRMASGEVIVTGGYDWNRQLQLASTELYEPATGVWRPAGDLALPRNGHTATLLRDGNVLVAGGFEMGLIPTNNRPMDSAELYRPLSEP